MYNQNSEEKINVKGEDNKTRQEKYKALIYFFNKDFEIKEALINMAPNTNNEFSEESRIEYLDKLYKEIEDFEFAFNNIANGFKNKSLKESYKKYFKRIKEKFTELSYGSKDISLSQIYKNIFTEMKPELVEQTKQIFYGYGLQNNFDLVPNIIEKVDSINELLHITHASVINNEELFKSMPIIDNKENMHQGKITLYGEKNKVSREIYDKIPLDMDIRDTDIVSMKDKTLMMIRDKGHALTIDINSADKDNVEVRYTIPKLCNEKMIRALPGINVSGITPNGANGFFVSKGENVTTDIIDFINKVPTDKDIELFETKNVDKVVEETFEEQITKKSKEQNNENESINVNKEKSKIENNQYKYHVDFNETVKFTLNIGDVKKLASGRRKNKIMKLFDKIKGNKNKESDKDDDKNK